MMCCGCHCGHYCPCCGRRLSPYWHPRPLPPWQAQPRPVAPPHVTGPLSINTAVGVGRQILQG